MARPIASDLTLWNRFFKSINFSLEGCWEWCRAFGKKNRYGVMAWQEKVKTAHRISWEFHFGPIPEGLSVLHKCDNRKCLRPEHLFLGTLEDNNKYMLAKGRGKTGEKISFEGEEHHLAEWARIKGIKAATLRVRLCAKWPLEKVFNTPTREHA